MCYTGHRALLLCGLPLQAAIKTGRQRKRYEGVRRVKHLRVQYAVLRQTNRLRFRHLGWQNITRIDTRKLTVFVAEMVRVRAECLKENRTGSKQSVTKISLLWNYEIRF